MTTSYPLGGLGRGLCARNREFALVQVGVSSRARRTREPTSVAVLCRPAQGCKKLRISLPHSVSLCESFYKASLPWLQSKIVRQLVQ